MLQSALAENFKTFLQWTVRASESQINYWRVLNMQILDQSGRELDDSIRRDVINIRDRALKPSRRSRSSVNSQILGYP